MTANWNPTDLNPNKWELLTQPGTFLLYENQQWKVYCNGRLLTQKKDPSCPFRWAEDVVRNNLDFWGER